MPRILISLFCVAGGIKSILDAENILAAGADKISINSPALSNPELINILSKRFGSQCVVVGIDSFEENGDNFVYQFTGDANMIQNTKRKTLDWAMEAADRGAGEIVLNCMNQDGMRNGFDIPQLRKISNSVSIPVIASGGAGSMEDFLSVFQNTNVTGALAASVFHKNVISIEELKAYLNENEVEVRLC